MPYQLAPYQRDAINFATKKHDALVGTRFRYEPTPNALTHALEEGYLRGELSSAERFMKVLEDNPDMNRDEMLGELHLFVMGINNHIHDKFGLGRRIAGVEFFTDKYVNRSENFVH